MEDGLNSPVKNAADNNSLNADVDDLKKDHHAKQDLGHSLSRTVFDENFLDIDSLNENVSDKNVLDKNALDKNILNESVLGENVLGENVVTHFNNVVNTTNFDFAQTLLHWFDVHGRHDLPWQCSDDPYRVWVSEIMLQQTQVKTVLQYFPRFIARFPNVAALAQASWDDVAPYWAGLGYYARARNLHKAAQQVHAAGTFPQDLAAWMALPGIGRSTAGAMLSLGLRQYGVILDGNVKRVLARFFAIQTDLTQPKALAQLWQIASALCPTKRNADYSQAIMDLGATICTPKNPLCLYCPMQQHCQGFKLGIAAQLPLKKAKATVPTKHSDVWLLQCGQGNNAQYLWQLRPNNGLWGGLISLPIASEQPERLAQLQAMGLQAQNLNLQLKHSFTHFTWQLQLKLFHVEPWQQAQLAADFNAMWLSLSEAQQKALPTAMKKLISLLKT